MSLLQTESHPISTGSDQDIQLIIAHSQMLNSTLASNDGSQVFPDTSATLGLQNRRLGELGRRLRPFYSTSGTAAEEPVAGHQCSYCQKWFAKKGDRNRHLRVHTGEKPYSCPHCPFKSAQKGNLKLHVFSKHNMNWKQ